MNRNASPSCRGSASDDRSSAPRDTKTWTLGATGAEKVWLASSRATEKVAPGIGSTGDGSRGTSYDVAAGGRVGQPDLDEPGLGSGRDLAVLDRGPVRRTPTSPGPSVVDAPDESVCSRAPGPPTTRSPGRSGCAREPLALAQQVLVVADHRAEGHVFRVVQEPNESACSVRRPAARSTNRSVPRRISTVI